MHTQKLFQLSGAASGGSQPLTSGFVSSVLSIQVGFCFLFKHTTQDLKIRRQLGRCAPWNKQDLKKERELLSLGCFLCTALVKEAPPPSPQPNNAARALKRGIYQGSSSRAAGRGLEFRGEEAEIKAACCEMQKNPSVHLVQLQDPSEFCPRSHFSCPEPWFCWNFHIGFAHKGRIWSPYCLAVPLCIFPCIISWYTTGREEEPAGMSRAGGGAKLQPAPRGHSSAVSASWTTWMRPPRRETQGKWQKKKIIQRVMFYLTL